FKTETLEKLIKLFKNNVLSFVKFIEQIKVRINNCSLPEIQCITANKMLLEFLIGESQYYGQGYEQSLGRFFKIEDKTALSEELQSSNQPAPESPFLI
ncbi:MAG: hypothetical protein Q8T04_17065, partial [Bacteroidota bacterium]|nr:hypothetical protein [Bacteroidota bacterium]